MNVEEWRSIPGYETSYEVSSRGRVRSLDRVVTDRRGRRHPKLGRVLTPVTNPVSGKLSVKLGKSNTKMVHILVLEAFVGPRPNGLCGLHWDDDPSNNCVDNLRWGTRSANMHDKVRNGRHHNAIKTTCKYGHPLSGENLSIDTLGKRVCRTCQRDRMRKYRNKRRSAVTSVAQRIEDPERAYDLEASAIEAMQVAARFAAV